MKTFFMECGKSIIERLIFREKKSAECGNMASREGVWDNAKVVEK